MVTSGPELLPKGVIGSVHMLRALIAPELEATVHSVAT